MKCTDVYVCNWAWEPFNLVHSVSLSLSFKFSNVLGDLTYNYSNSNFFLISMHTTIIRGLAALDLLYVITKNNEIYSEIAELSWQAALNLGLVYWDTALG